MGTGVDEEGRGGGGRRKKRMRWQEIVSFGFCSEPTGDRTEGAQTRTKGGTGGGGREGERVCVRRDLITWYWV